MAALKVSVFDCGDWIRASSLPIRSSSVTVGWESIGVIGIE